MTMANITYSPTETLQKLERLTQLETVVAEQRIRIEKYRTMYETLKAEHSQSDDVLARKDTELAALKSEMSATEARFCKALEQVKFERDAKTQECEELRVQILSPQRLEVIKMKLQEEIEGPYRQKLESLELENDQYRSTFNKIRYDYSFLKSEFEHEQAQHKNVLQEIQTQHQLEIESLMKEKEALIQRLKTQEASSDMQKLRTLQRDNSQLNMKIRSLLAELEGIREQRESSGLQSDHVSRLQARQVTELLVRCKTLEAEAEACKVQNSKLQSEHERLLKEQEELMGKLYNGERENHLLKNQLNELGHTHKIKLSDVRIELTKDKGELERERDCLRQELGTLKSNVQILEQNAEHLKKSIEEKEKDAVRRIQLVQEAEWEKMSNLETIKIQLESQVSELEKLQQSQEAIQKKQVDHLQEQIRQLKEEKGKLDKDFGLRKAQQSQQSSLKRELEEEQVRSQEMKRKAQTLQTEIEKHLTNEQQLKDEVEKLKNTISLLRSELSMTQMQSNADMNGLAKEIQEQRVKWEEERQGLGKKIEELQKEIKSAKKSEEKLKMLAKRRDGKRKQEINGLTEQIALLKAREERLEIEKNAIQKNVNLEHERTRRRLEKLKRGHAQFNRVLNVSGAGIPDFSLFNTTGVLGSTRVDRSPKTGPLLDIDLEPDLFSASTGAEDNL